MLDELVDRPVVEGHADDAAEEEAALLEAVQRAEGHHPSEVAGDPEDDEDVGLLRVGAQSSSALTLIREERSCANPPQLHSMTAFARSSPVESSARWTDPHAICAAFPVIVGPRAN